MCVYFRMCFVLRKRRFSLMTVLSPTLFWPPSLIRDPFDPGVNAQTSLFSLPHFLFCFPSLINTLIKEPHRPSNHCLPYPPDSCGTYWCVYIRDHCLFFPYIKFPRLYSSGAAHPLRPALCLSVYQSQLNSHHHS